MTDELDGKVTVTVAGEDVIVPRPPFRRFKNLLPMVVDLDVEGDEKKDLDPGVMIDVAEEIARVLFADDADEYLDRLYTPAEFIAFLTSAMAALQLGEAGASTGT